MRHITTHDAPATGLRGIGDSHWHVRGTCHGMDIEDAEAVFFPGPRDHEDIAEAKELCGWCPVRRDCLDFALENGLKEGIWGGLTKAERAPLHKNLHKRRDYRRVVAFFQGRVVHLNEAERQIVIDHAYVRGWRPERLAVALRISRTHARDLLRQSATKVLDRDRTYGMPKPKKKRKKKRKKIAPATAVPAPRAKPGARPAAPLDSVVSAPLGKAA